MKTIYEVIDELNDLNKDRKCMYCPYDTDSSSCSRGSCLYDDALEYLELIRRRLNAMGDGGQ